MKVDLNLQSSSSFIAGCLFVVIAAIGFSAKSILIKLAYRHNVDAETLLALRMVLSLPFFLIPAVWLQSSPSNTSLTFGDRIGVIVLGLLGYYLSSYLDFLGLQYVSAGLERLILFLYPTMVVLMAAFGTRQSVDRTQTLALLASYTGILLVFAGDVLPAAKDTWIGGMLVFGSAVSYALYLVGSERRILMLGPVRFTAWAMTVSCLACIGQFLYTHSFQDMRLPVVVYAYGLAMALFSTVLPSFLVSEGIRRIGASRASLIATIGPVSTIVLAHLFLGETLTPVQMMGSMLVLVGAASVGKPAAAKA